MRLRKLDEFSEALDNCLTWRKHELQNLDSYFTHDKKNKLRPLIKGSLLLTYAHWEGGIKDAAILYLRHVEQQKARRRDLCGNFLALESISAIKTAALSNQIILFQQAVEHIKYNLDHTFKLPNITLIDTESNLSARVFRNVLDCIGLTASWVEFETKERFIDKALLKMRNDVAHTGRTQDEVEIDLPPLIRDVRGLLDDFGRIVLNAAALKSYLHAI